MVEHRLAKARVASSNLVSRSIPHSGDHRVGYGGMERSVQRAALPRRGTQVVRERSAKPLCAGSIPARASNSSGGPHLNSIFQERSQDRSRRACQALAPNGRLVVQDFILNPDKAGPLHATLFSLNILSIAHLSDAVCALMSWVAAAQRHYRFRRRSDSQLPSALHPPSTDKAWPLTKPLSSSSARKAMARAMSSGLAKRPMGIRPVMSASV